MELRSDTAHSLVMAAASGLSYSYSPYSKFRVGAAILFDDGEIAIGANVENASFGLTICAERVAATQVLMRGGKNFRALALVSKGCVTPCGACRQFLSEWNQELPIVFADLEQIHFDSSGKPVSVTETQFAYANLRELFPNPFGIGQ